MTDPFGLWPPRRPDHRKGDFGRVVVAGGSHRYSGAPGLNALAALRAGADMAVVVAPRRAADVVATFAPDLITVPCEGPFPDPEVVLAEASAADALVVGGGVERSPTAHAALRRILAGAPCPVVADAEALHALAGEPGLLSGRPALLTPHGGEFALLAGRPWPAGEAERQGAARELAARLGVTVLVKGARDVVAEGTRAHVDEEGSPFLTKGGWGDLVAGAAGALLARGAAPWDAGRGAAWLVGRAGRLAAARHGEAALASDALAHFGEAIGGT